MLFRACLSDLNPKSEENQLLSILGLPDLHLSTNDHSAQALSRNLATAVEVATIHGMNALFLCPRRPLNPWEGDILQRQMSVWETRLPVLGVSARNGDDRIWSGRTVMIGNVFGQWCRVVKARDQQLP